MEQLQRNQEKNLSDFKYLQKRLKFFLLSQLGTF